MTVMTRDSDRGEEEEESGERTGEGGGCAGLWGPDCPRGLQGPTLHLGGWV